jgi:hypothetical protein
MNTVPVERLAEVFVEVADTLVEEFDIIEFLQMVTACSASLTDVAAARLLLADAGGQLQFMAASPESARLLELFQVETPEGPLRGLFPQRHTSDQRRPADGQRSLAPVRSARGGGRVPLGACPADAAQG